MGTIAARATQFFIGNGLREINFNLLIPRIVRVLSNPEVDELILSRREECFRERNQRCGLRSRWEELTYSIGGKEHPLPPPLSRFGDVVTHTMLIEEIDEHPLLFDMKLPDYVMPSGALADSTTLVLSSTTAIGEAVKLLKVSDEGNLVRRTAITALDVWAKPSVSGFGIQRPQFSFRTAELPLPSAAFVRLMGEHWQHTFLEKND